MTDTTKQLMQKTMDNLLMKYPISLTVADSLKNDIEQSLTQVAEQTEKETLEWVLANCSGGGDWRRKIIMRLEERDKDREEHNVAKS